MQLSIDFEPDLLRQYPQFMDAVRSSVYSCGRPFKHIAADLDMSVSELSRKLAENPNDNVHFPLRRLPDLLRATGDMRPLMWLCAEFLPDPEQRRDSALAGAEKLLRELGPLVAQLRVAADTHDDADSPIRPAVRGV